MHGMASVRWKPARPAMLRNFRGTMDSSPKSILMKEKIVRQASENKLSLAEMNLPIRSAKAGVRTLTFDSDVLSRRYLSKTACGSVGFLCQLGHIREKCLRLADEQTHVC